MWEKEWNGTQDEVELLHGVIDVNMINKVMVVDSLHNRFHISSPVILPNLNRCTYLGLATSPLAIVTALTVEKLKVGCKFKIIVVDLGQEHCGGFVSTDDGYPFEERIFFTQ